MLGRDEPETYSALQRPLEQFHAKTKRLKIHPTELALLWIVWAHLVFLPWEIGGIKFSALGPRKGCRTYPGKREARAS